MKRLTYQNEGMFLLIWFADNSQYSICDSRLAPFITYNLLSHNRFSLCPVCTEKIETPLEENLIALRFAQNMRCGALQSLVVKMSITKTNTWKKLSCQKLIIFTIGFSHEGKNISRICSFIFSSASDTSWKITSIRNTIINTTFFTSSSHKQSRERNLDQTLKMVHLSKKNPRYSLFLPPYKWSKCSTCFFSFFVWKHCVCLSQWWACLFGTRAGTSDLITAGALMIGSFNRC